MKNRDDYIGMGINPTPGMPDIPMGLGMALFKNTQAHGYFSSLSTPVKTNVINYVQTGNITGSDAKRKISDVVEHLSEGNTSFLS